MAKAINAAKVPGAGKNVGTEHKDVVIKDDIISTKIGEIYLQMEKRHGQCLIKISTDCVEDLNSLIDFLSDEHGVWLETDQLFGDCFGEIEAEIGEKTFDASRKWIANNTSWRFTRHVDDSDLIDDIED